jgi:hypothetical protein
MRGEKRESGLILGKEENQRECQECNREYPENVAHVSAGFREKGQNRPGKENEVRCLGQERAKEDCGEGLVALKVEQHRAWGACENEP